jgi:tripartite-type tricarboxylate transporter receptor subunit TctC
VRPATQRKLSGFVALAVAAMLAGTAARAQTPVSFEGKTVAIVVGYAAGGGTDLSARALAAYLSKYLPGNPSVIVNNLPGADGMIAMNSFVQRTKPDGLTLTMGATTTSDPLLYRRPQSHFDPTKFKFVGGIGRGGNFLVIRTDAEKRLFDKSQPPVIMGALGGVPRSGQQMTAWGVAYLGWNAKWVVGYRGTKDLLVALERGEIEMTATGNLGEVQRLIDSGVVKIQSQSGMYKNGDFVPRAENVPLLVKLMDGKFTDPVEKQSFAYWTGLTSIDKWLALPPDTPAEIVAVYRQAFDKTMSDPEFIARSQGVSEDIVPQSAADVTRLLDSLGSIPPEAIEQISVMLRKQGLDAQ